MAGTRNVRLWPLLALVSMAGCFQIDTRVKLHADGSATITERLQFPKRLLDLDAQLKETERRFEKRLSREGSLNRMKKMGKGITLVSHTVRKTDKGARESISVYKIPDLADFRYMSPWPAYQDYGENNGFRFHLYPADYGHGGHPGQLGIDLKTLNPPKGHSPPRKGELVPKPPSPRNMQVYREMAPLFRDILQDFHVKLVFEAYCPLTAVGYGYRGKNEKSFDAEIINVSSGNLDNFGGKFLENEEVMLDLVRLDFGSPEIVEHVRNFPSNRTLPAFVPLGSQHMWYSGGGKIIVRPSMQLFKKYVEGKDLLIGYTEKRKFTFDEVGYKPVAKAPKK